MAASVDEAKRRAAHEAVDLFVKDGDVVGVGSGSTVVFMAERLGQRVRGEGLSVTCIPSSFQARQLIVDNKLPLGDLDRWPAVDVTIDGADEVDSQLNLIKGGGGCLTQEKILAANSAKFVVITDYRKQSERLCQTFPAIPVEVIPLAYVPIMRTLTALGGDPALRLAVKKAGPVVTDNGNFILDVKFPPLDPSSAGPLEKTINNIAGVVSCGLFCGMADAVCFGMQDGSVVWKHAPPKTQ